ncbi:MULTISPECIES: hypothetical protein [Paenibacillus]|nr:MULTISPECIES: hypothetical protein [Paenibacillus]
MNLFVYITKFSGFGVIQPLGEDLIDIVDYGAVGEDYTGVN